MGEASASPGKWSGLMTFSWIKIDQLESRNWWQTVKKGAALFCMPRKAFNTPPPLYFMLAFSFHKWKNVGFKFGSVGPVNYGKKY